MTLVIYPCSNFGVARWQSSWMSLNEDISKVVYLEKKTLVPLNLFQKMETVSPKRKL
jgi:hypothetical protein